MYQFLVKHLFCLCTRYLSFCPALFTQAYSSMFTWSGLQISAGYSQDILDKCLLAPPFPAASTGFSITKEIMVDIGSCHSTNCWYSDQGHEQDVVYQSRCSGREPISSLPHEHAQSGEIPGTNTEREAVPYLPTIMKTVTYLIQLQLLLSCEVELWLRTYTDEQSCPTSVSHTYASKSCITYWSNLGSHPFHYYAG